MRVEQIAASRRSPRAQSRNSRAISSGGFRCRSALASSRRPAFSIVTPSRMQVRTSCRSRCAGRVIEHVVGREQRHARSLRRCAFSSREPARVVAAPRHGRAEPDRARRALRQTRRSSVGRPSRLRAGITISSRSSRMGEQVVEMQDAVALLARRRLPWRQQPA